MSQGHPRETLSSEVRAEVSVGRGLWLESLGFHTEEATCWSKLYLPGVTLWSLSLVPVPLKDLDPTHNSAANLKNFQNTQYHLYP